MNDSITKAFGYKIHDIATQKLVKIKFALHNPHDQLFHNCTFLLESGTLIFVKHMSKCLFAYGIAFGELH